MKVETTPVFKLLRSDASTQTQQGCCDSSNKSLCLSEGRVTPGSVEAKFVPVFAKCFGLEAR